MTESITNIPKHETV